MRRALALSRNIPSVRTAQMVGMDSIVETARQAGITTKLDPNLSLALGSSAVTPLDMAGAYSTFARSGVAIKPQTLRRIENNKGQVIYVEDQKYDKVFTVEPVAELVDVMQDVVKYGTGAGAKLADRPVAGKTGTADAGKDIWFIGFTPDLVTATWGGNDENLPIPGTHVTGGDVMAKIWRHYMEGYYKLYPTPPGSFIPPSNEKTAAKTDQIAKKDDAGVPTDKPVQPSAVTLSPANQLTPETPKPDSGAPVPSATQTAVTSQPSTQIEPKPAPSRVPTPAPEVVSAAHNIMPSLAPERSAPKSDEPQSSTSTSPRRLYPAAEAPAGGTRLFPSSSPGTVAPQSAPATPGSPVPELRPPINTNTTSPDAPARSM